MIFGTEKILRCVLGMLVVTFVCLLSLALFQRQALANNSSLHFQMVEQSWDDFSPTERKRALKNFQRFQQLPGERKRDLEDAYDRWQKLPAPERRRIQRNYERYRGMNSDEKEEFRLKYKHWQSQR